MRLRIGTAGWAIPAGVRDRFPLTGGGLERYAARLGAVEINSTFYRRHRISTFERWAAATPADFRFAVKAPREITHRRKLENCEDLLADLAADLRGLGDRLGPVLIQTPPGLAFDEARAEAFMDAFEAVLEASIVLEPRHASWFTTSADLWLASRRVARVAADPEPAPGAGLPGGSGAHVYFRLHGSPDMYRSAYGLDRLKAILQRVRAAGPAGAERWAIFDNTASGAAAANALALVRMARSA
ncbi:DUF72 domain-containing protein [Brevundimonas sp. P7753]|uniref:DUF72 domain-containing protein n=1 Tax=Brevundimonas sp. P7753 TaxID=2726982 RepID=UPI0015BEBF74|nr:DUF72 domain-containing protein [Brevundimonas sp. P7753]NWE51825.1 DUF72 domain-containing protein [Brevundimonas sp. P7753]